MSRYEGRPLINSSKPLYHFFLLVTSSLPRVNFFATINRIDQRSSTTVSLASYLCSQHLKDATVLSSPDLIDLVAIATMSSQRSAAINHLQSNASTSPSMDVYSTAMPYPASNVQAPIEVVQSPIVRPRRPLNLPPDDSPWNALYGGAQPMRVRGQHPRHSHRQLPQSPLPAAAYDFQQLSRHIDPFDANFQGAQRFAPNAAPASYHGQVRGRQGRLQRTAPLQMPNVHTSQQLGHQSHLYGGQQAASMAPGDYVGNGSSSQTRGYVQVPNMYTRSSAPQYVQHGHHYTHAGNGSHHQHVDHFLHMGGAMMHEVPRRHEVTGRVNRPSPSYVNLEDSPEPSLIQDDHVTDQFYPGQASPYKKSNGTKLNPKHVPVLSGTVNRGTSSGPHQVKAPAQSQDNHGSRSTETTCQMRGQLFHRTHPGGRWGKFVMDLMDNDNTDEGPEPAVKHSAIFYELLQWAKRNSTYRKYLYLQSSTLVS